MNINKNCERTSILLHVQENTFFFIGMFKKIRTHNSGSHVKISTIPCYLNLNNTKFITTYGEEGILRNAIKSIRDLNHENFC